MIDQTQIDKVSSKGPQWAKTAIDRILTGRATKVDKILARPESIMEAGGLNPDPWQSMVLRSFARRMLLLCSRQSGKSQVSAALALHSALTVPDSLVLLLSRALRQSGELFRDKLLRLYNAMGRPLASGRESSLQMKFSNGSRIVSLPGSEGTIRSYSSVSLLIVDEASRVPNELYYSVRPMLAVSGGRLVAATTPFGKRGWFYDEWNGGADWLRVKIPASECPRIPRDFLQEEKTSLGARWYAQEYECSFEEVDGAEWPGEFFTDILFDHWPRGLKMRGISLDPSKGRESKSGDYSAFVFGGVDSDGVIWVDAILERIPINQIADTAASVYLAMPDRAHVFAVEANQFQELLVEPIEFASRKVGVILPVMPLHNFLNKIVRIRTLTAYLARKKIRIMNSLGGRLLLSQLRDFPQGEHDDGPDALEMLIRAFGELLGQVEEGGE